MWWRSASPERGAIRPQQPVGSCIFKSVDTNAFPLAGTLVSYAVYKSRPADLGDRLVGVWACSVSFTKWRTAALFWGVDIFLP